MRYIYGFSTGIDEEAGRLGGWGRHDSVALESLGVVGYANDVLAAR